MVGVNDITPLYVLIFSLCESCRFGNTSPRLQWIISSKVDLLYFAICFLFPWGHHFLGLISEILDKDQKKTLSQGNGKHPNARIKGQDHFSLSTLSFVIWKVMFIFFFWIHVISQDQTRWTYLVWQCLVPCFAQVTACFYYIKMYLQILSYYFTTCEHNSSLFQQVLYLYYYQKWKP